MARVKNCSRAGWFSENTWLAGPKVTVPVGAGLALAIAVVGTFWLGILPGPVTQVANDAVAQLVAFAP